MKIWMQEMTSQEVRDYLNKDDIVIVPIGSTEVHGEYLPLGTDTYEAIDYASDAARRAGVLCTPPIWFGDSHHHMAFPGTISLRSETLVKLLTDVCESLIHHGFKNIIIFNGHRWANIPVIEIAGKRVKMKFPEILFAIIEPTMIAKTTHLEIQESQGEGQHAGEFETSHMLYAHPELVNMNKARRVCGKVIPSSFVSSDNFATGNKVKIVKSKEDQRKMTDYGNIGDPTKASREKGERLFNAVVDNTVNFIQEIRKFKLS